MSKRSTATRETIVRACLATLREEGFAGTSARAVARRGGFGQALIYYHFADMQALLVAAVERASSDRLARYHEVLEPVSSVAELAAALGDLYREDVAIGHVAAMQEIVGGASSLPGLGRQVIELLRPWAEFATETIARLVAGTPFESLVPAEDAAFAALALYMGMETMTHLNGDREPGERLLQALAHVAPLADAVRESSR
ncbi:MAG TPA: TetR/AcrR family transcriptional regulator [Candidatus Dormibacteraeota bacterium]